MSHDRVGVNLPKRRGTNQQMNKQTDMCTKFKNPGVGRHLLGLAKIYIYYLFTKDVLTRTSKFLRVYI